jgi:2-succinyl-5-enolpyruvyl-6-hydroxy-3-cyclohexene-1-carboxylate synthase
VKSLSRNSILNQINQLWGYLIVTELVRNGVNYFVISPGSRSTPLTLAVAQHPQAQKTICIDERGAAFHAVGYARATGEPAVLICSSGTAAANYLPAVIEAATDGIPMIILSADRPPELRQTGANQTIEQVDLYGSYPVWKFDLPCPTAEISPNVVLTTIDLAVFRSRRSAGGVVQLNCMFREPLAPTGEPIELPPSLAQWERNQSPYTSYARSLTIPAASEIRSLFKTIVRTQRGVLVVGQLKSADESLAVAELAARLNWAVFADIQSGLRLSDDVPNLVHYFDRLLLTAAAVELEQIETVIQIGTRIVSKSWLQWLEQHPPNNYVVIANDAERHDPSHLVSLRLESDIIYLCDRLCQQLPELIPSVWAQNLVKVSDRIGVSVDKFLKTQVELNEISIVRSIAASVPSGNGLWVANSMPIRDLDIYGNPPPPSGTPPRRGINPPPPGRGINPQRVVRVGANRGTSGIEGAIAAATGFAVGLQAGVTAIVGDLSTLYDLNSLALLRHSIDPVIVVVINNDGGGIFSFLPLAKSLQGRIAKSTDLFDTYFGTPHGLDFANAAAMFGLDYYHPQHQDELIKNYIKALANGRSAIIEVTTDRSENWQLHQDLQAYIQRQFGH